MSLDLIGMSSHSWKQQHVANHHVYTNVHEADPDINIEELVRLSVFQPLRKWHVFQWIYVTGIYSFMMLKIKYYDDFVKYFKQAIGPIRTAGFNRLQTAIFLGGKL